MSNREFDPDAAALPDAGVFGLPDTLDEARVVLIPVPWDATTSYRAGAARGPEAIRAASRQVDLRDVDTGRPYEAGIAMLEEPDDVVMWNHEARAAALPVIAAGGIVDGNDDLEEALARVNELGARVNEWVEGSVEEWLDKDKLVGIVGGDHSTPFGAIAAIAKRHPGLGVLHLDAHADLREAYEGFTWSHASIMWNVVDKIPGVARLVQVGIRDLGDAELELIENSKGRITTYFDSALRGRLFDGSTWSAECARILETLPREVYLSFDIDGLDPSLCPHTGTPVPGGLSFAEVNHLLRRLVESGRRVVGFDLNEVAPGPDGDEWDANVGARLLYKMIGWSLRSQA